MPYDFKSFEEALKSQIHFIRSGFTGTLQGWLCDASRDFRELLRPALPPTSELLRMAQEPCKKQENELLRGSDK